MRFLDLFLNPLRLLEWLAFRGSLLPSPVNELCLSQNTSESLPDSGTLTSIFSAVNAWTGIIALKQSPVGLRKGCERHPPLILGKNWLVFALPAELVTVSCFGRHCL